MGAPQPTAPRIFVSHSHQDDAFTARLVADLRHAGADVRVDMTELGAGAFVQRINAALDANEWLVLVLTPAAIVSPYVQEEMDAAINLVHQGRMREVIPFLAAPCAPASIPPLWDARHHYDRYDATRDYAAALAALLGAIGLTPPRQATASTVQPKHNDGFPPVADFDQVTLAEKGWAIIGSSRIGLAHTYEGKYREDAIAAEIVDGMWHLAAVADGGSTYKLARLGAHVAVQAAVAAIRHSLSVMADELGSHEARASRVVESGLRAAYDALHREGRRLQEEADRKQSGVTVTVKDLSTTLVLVLHRELPNGVHLVAGGHIGDGAVVARTIDGETARLEWLSEADGERLGHGVTFLTDVPDTEEDWGRRVTAKLIASPVVYCLAMTDGISDDFVPLEGNLTRLEKPMFQAALGENDPATAARKLEDLLGYERHGSFDDRSLICIYKQGITPWT